MVVVFDLGGGKKWCKPRTPSTSFFQNLANPHLDKRPYGRCNFLLHHQIWLHDLGDQNIEFALLDGLQKPLISFPSRVGEAA